jgi:hypothetical protein
VPEQSFSADVMDVTTLARQYGRVLVSRRLLRAFAVGTTMAAFMLLIVAAIMPVILAYTPSSAPPSQRLWTTFLVVLLMAFVTALAIGLVVLYVRALAALARGSSRVATIVMVLVSAWFLWVALTNLRVFLLPREQAPLQIMALAALVIQSAVAGALIIGPWQLRRADPLARRVFEEPRLGAGWKAEVGRLLDFADVSTLSHKNRLRALLVLSAALLVEGSAFYTLLHWSGTLMETSEKPAPELMNVSPAVALSLLLVFTVVVLLLSGWLIRVMLRWAKRLRARARRMTLRSANEVVTADTRPPILFLRSFEKEHVPLEGAQVPWFLRAFDPGAEYGTLEELIVLGLTYVGPVVAVADPSRPDVPEGAARWRLGDDEWQRFVEQQIARAGLIVVGVAETEGLRWEMDALARVPAALEKTIFVFPPGITRESRVASLVWNLVGEPLQFMRLRESSQHLLGVARLPDGKLAAIVASEISEPAYQTALRLWIALRQS